MIPAEPATHLDFERPIQNPEVLLGNGGIMRQPSRNRIARIPFANPNGLIIFPNGLNWNLSAGSLTPTEQLRADSGANRMPRPGYRWSRRRSALRFARLRKPAACPMTRLQDTRRMDPSVTDAPGIRHELVSRVRKEIDAGTYDNPAKLEAALERMLSHLTED